jgi:putative addiction module component (TIGR02574 family)
MGEKMKQLGIDKLGVEERLALLDEICASVTSDPGTSLPLTPAQLAELDRRLDELDAGGDAGRPAAEALADIHRSR